MSKYYVFTAFILLTISLWTLLEHLLSTNHLDAAGLVGCVATTDKTYS